MSGRKYLTVQEPYENPAVCDISVHTWEEIKAMLPKVNGNFRIYRVNRRCDPVRLQKRIIRTASGEVTYQLEDCYGNIVEK